MLSVTILPILFLVIWSLFGVWALVMLLRLVFNYADPNPFGKVGRFGFKTRKLTEKWIYPAARFLAMYGIDTRLAPIVTLLIGLMLTYFAVQIIANTFSIIDGLTAAVAAGNVKAFIGFILYGLLSLLVLFIFIRFISSWFVFSKNTFLGFVTRVTEPVLAPFRRLIPPIGMFDISAMIALLLIGFLQTLVIRVFVSPV